MNIDIKVYPNARKSLVKEDQGTLKVYVQAPAEDGRANEAAIALLADYFNVKKRQIQIIKGLKSRVKTVTIGKV